MKRVISICVHLLGAVTLLHITSEQLNGFVFNLLLGMVLFVILLESLNFNQLRENPSPGINILIWGGSNFLLWLSLPRMEYNSSVISASIVMMLCVFGALLVRRDVAHKGDTPPLSARLIQLLDPLITMTALAFLTWVFVRNSDGEMVSFFEFLYGQGALILTKNGGSVLGENALFSLIIAGFCFVAVANKSGIYLKSPTPQVMNSLSIWITVVVLIATAIHTAHNMGWKTASFALLVGCLVSQLKVLQVIIVQEDKEKQRSRY